MSARGPRRSDESAGGPADASRRGGRSFPRVPRFGFGSGPIRGFATTLTLGIITSMFSSTIFTRMLLAVWVRWRRPAELVI